MLRYTRARDLVSATDTSPAGSSPATYARPGCCQSRALFRLAEIAADDVGEFLQLDMHVGVERIDVVHGDLPARHVPFVVPHPLVVFLDIGVGAVFLAERGDVGLRIFVADRLVGVEAQHLVRADRPGHFLIDIGLDQLRPPIAVVAADEADGRDVVQQAGEHHLLGQVRP